MDAAQLPPIVSLGWLDSMGPQERGSRRCAATELFAVRSLVEHLKKESAGTQAPTRWK